MDELLIALLSDALHGKTAERLPEEGELRGLLDAARRHGVAAAALAALPDGGGPQARMLAAKLHAVDMAQEYEGTALERAMIDGLRGKGFTFQRLTGKVKPVLFNYTDYIG